MGYNLSTDGIKKIRVSPDYVRKSWKDLTEVEHHLGPYAFRIHLESYNGDMISSNMALLLSYFIDGVSGSVYGNWFANPDLNIPLFRPATSAYGIIEMTEEFIEAPIEEEVNGVIIYTTDNYTPVFGTYYIGCDLTPPRVESILLTDPNGSTLSTDQYVQEVSPNIQVVSIGDQYSPPVGISICAQGPGSPTTYPDENEENDPGGNYLVASFYSEVSGEDWYESQWSYSTDGDLPNGNHL